MFERIWVSNRRLSDDFLPDVAKIIAYKSVDKILLREADLDEKSYENLAKDVLDVVKSSGVKLILHSYFSVAERLGIDELHVPFELFSKVGRGGFCGKIGVSAHSLKEALSAREFGADYVVVGHIFDTPSHAGVAGHGIGFLREIIGNLDVPVYAIGGINDGNVELIENSGASGSYMMRGVILNLGKNK